MNPHEFDPLGFHLCYVSHPWAYFTTRSLEEQDGFGWDVKDFPINSGGPYGMGSYGESFSGEPWSILKVAFDGSLDLPYRGTDRVPWSVLDINRKHKCPWLENIVLDIHVPAGTPLSRFVELVDQSGGRVYLPVTLVGGK